MKNKEEIIFIINSPYPNYSGGIENWLFNVSKRLCDDFSILIVSNFDKTMPVCYETDFNKIKIKSIKTFVSFSFSKLFVRSYINVLDFFIFSLSAQFFLNKYLNHKVEKKSKTTIVCLDTMFCVLAGLSAKNKFSNVNLISSCRGPHAEIYSTNFPILKRLFFYLEKKMLAQVDKLWANGYDMQEVLKKKGFNSIIMFNGVDYKSLKNIVPKRIDVLNYPDLPAIINISSLLPIKGIIQLIDAIEYLILYKKIKVNLIFVGKGNPEKYLKIVKAKGIIDFVYFLGHQSTPIAFAKNASVLTCLSGGGGLSMAAIESMVTGLPVIAWDTPVYRQFNFKKKYLKLVDYNNSVALSNGIEQILKNYRYYKSIAEEASEYVKLYDWSNVITSFKKNIE